MQRLHVPISLACSAELEYRVQAQLLPLLLNLDQAALTFLQQFFAPASGDTAVGVGTSHAMADVPGNLVQPAASGEPFVQRCEVQPFTLTINYHPHRVDLAALRRWVAATVGMCENQDADAIVL